MTNPIWKTCPKCRIQKTVFDFFKTGSYCKDCASIYSQEYNNARKEARVIQNRKYVQDRKIEVLTYYSRGALRCVKCEFSDIRALSIDHIDGGGGYHRKSDTSLGTNFYRWLKRNGYPEGYQVLCMNCQFIKRYEKHEHA